jgi:hypothetical protein
MAMPLYMSNTDAAYLAGLLDGEGCISIVFREPKSVSRETGTQVVIQVRISMTDYETVKWCADVTGTPDKIYAIAARNAKHRDQWCWSPGINSGYDILSQCLPYLKTKRRQAEIFLELVEIRRASTRSERNWDKQFPLVEENMKLNKTGRSDESMIVGGE